MIQRVLIEEFLQELFARAFGDEDEASCYATEFELVEFVRDWLEDRKGEL